MGSVLCLGGDGVTQEAEPNHSFSILPGISRLKLDLETYRFGLSITQEILARNTSQVMPSDRLASEAEVLNLTML